MSVELVTAAKSADNVRTVGEKRAAVVGPESEACEQLILLLEVLGWETERAAAIADLGNSKLKLIFIDGRPGAAPIDSTVLVRRDNAEMVVVYGANLRLSLWLRNMNKIINFLDLPIDIALAEGFIEQAS